MFVTLSPSTHFTIISRFVLPTPRVVAYAITTLNDSSVNDIVLGKEIMVTLSSSVGDADGAAELGELLGSEEGSDVLGATVGNVEGDEVVGATEGDLLGCSEGVPLGLREGVRVGESVGHMSICVTIGLNLYPNSR